MTIGVVQHAPLYTKLIDRLAPISKDLAVKLKAEGVNAVGRYLETLSAHERDDLFSAGLGILPLTKAPASPLSAVYGHSRATVLLQLASALDLPAGVHFMIDLEAQHGNHIDVVGYNSAISSEIAKHGYITCAYVGAGQPLSAAELFALPDVHLYWRGGSLAIPEPACGFALWQIPPLEQTVAGEIVDMNVTGADLRGRRPMLWCPN